MVCYFPDQILRIGISRLNLPGNALPLPALFLDSAKGSIHPVIHFTPSTAPYCRKKIGKRKLGTLADHCADRCSVILFQGTHHPVDSDKGGLLLFGDLPVLF